MLLLKASWRSLYQKFVILTILGHGYSLHLKVSGVATLPIILFKIQALKLDWEFQTGVDMQLLETDTPKRVYPLICLSCLSSFIYLVLRFIVHTN